MKVQKLVQVDNSDGAYLNFFFTPGSIGSLEKHIHEGWVAILIKDIPGVQCVVLFEKECS